MRGAVLIAITLTAQIIAPWCTGAQGVTYVSTLDRPSTGNLAVGSDSWIAQGFYILTTDPNHYLLNSVQLLMDPAYGNPGEFTVSIYSNPWGSSTALQNHLGDLNGLTHPLEGGLYTYSASDITLSSSEVYAVVVTAAAPITGGAYNWSTQIGGIGSGTWVIANGYATSPDGATWTGHPREGAMQLAINATLIPEPTTGAMLGLGLALLGLWRYRR